MKVSVKVEAVRCKWRYDAVAAFFRTLLSGEPVRMTVGDQEFQVAAFWSLVDDGVDFEMERVTEE